MNSNSNMDQQLISNVKEVATLILLFAFSFLLVLILEKMEAVYDQLMNPPRLFRAIPRSEYDEYMKKLEAEEKSNG